MNYKKFISTLTKRGFQVYYEYVGSLLGVSINMEELKISVLQDYDRYIVKLYSVGTEITTFSATEDQLLDALKIPTSGQVLTKFAKLCVEKSLVIEHSLVRALPEFLKQRLMPTRKGLLLMVDTIKELYISLVVEDLHVIEIKLYAGSKLLTKRILNMKQGTLSKLVMTIVTLVEQSAEKYERFMQAQEAGMEYCYEFWKD